MNCEQCRDKLYELAFDLLDADERRKAMAHVAGCKACRLAYEQAMRQRRTLKESPRPAPPKGLARRTIAAVAAMENSPMPHKPVEPELRWLGGRTFWKIAAALLLIVALAVIAQTARVVERHADPVEVSLYSQKDLTPGLPAAIRVFVHDAHRNEPLADARVLVKLASDTGPTIRFAKATTDDLGVAAFETQLPDDLPEGDYRIEVEVDSTKGKTDLTRTVLVKRSFRTLITTDKPLYQPGQLIHVRTLTLANADLRPVAARGITIEIRDPKGNKVFKKILNTSEFGIASTDFQLADQVNLGDYTVAAIVGDTTSERSVNVRRYVLPKFRVDLALDRKYYAPGETVACDIHAEYTFGKPVEGARVLLKANEFIEKFRAFATAEATTGPDGRCSLTIPLKTFFVGQDLKKGDAIVQLEATVTDKAGHKQTKTLDLSVTERPIRIEVFPESGELVRNVENILYIVTAYPDGRPAQTTLTVGRTRRQLRTSSLGIAKVRITPADPRLKLTISAEDARGVRAGVVRELRVGERSDGFLIRPDRAAYRTGDTIHVDVISAVQSARIFLDIVKDRRTVLMKAINVRNGLGALDFDLPHDLFGTIELHAYRLLPDGNLVRDSKVVQVTRADALSIAAELDKQTYRPGERALLKLLVRDRDGAPIQAALGLAGVDEAVFALHDMRPGLEEIYFIIQQEILKPRYEIHARAPVTPAQFIRPEPEKKPELKEAEVVLFASAGGSAGPDHTAGKTFEQRNRSYRRAEKRYVKGLLAAGALTPACLFALFVLGMVAYAALMIFRRVPIEGASHADIGMLRKTLRNLSRWWIAALYLPVSAFYITMVIAGGLDVDPAETWGLVAAAILALPICALLARSARRVRRVDASRAFPLMRKMVWCLPWAFLAAVAAVVAGLFATAERLIDGDLTAVNVLGIFIGCCVVSGILALARRSATQPTTILRRLWLGLSRPLLVALPLFLTASLLLPSLARAGGPQFAGGVKRFARPDMPEASVPERAIFGDSGVPTGESPSPGGEKPLKAPSRIRRFFPETLFWQPQLITDATGRAQLEIPLADSITTWRVAMSAVSRAGQLGAATRGIRVFQDFFVDIDFPVALTQNDLVSAPVAIFNYLDKPQRVRIEVQSADWCELLDPPARELTIGPKDVAAVSFKLRALKPGRHSLTVKAFGSEMADAVQREVTITPDGRPVVQTFNGTLKGTITRKILIPESAIPGANDLLVKIYPGAFSQVVEGLDGIFRMPFGCFEQTSSVTYPNILALDYMRRTNQIKPDLEMKALNFINLGYQRLLSFEVKGGGFEWFGKAPAHNVLTAYGLMEICDMAKVYDVDPAVIERTRRWLLEQQQGDGSWEPTQGGIPEGAINAFQGATFRTTAYIAWALAESGQTGDQLQKALAYLSEAVSAQDDPYTLALCANAFIAAGERADARRILTRLDEMKTVEEGLVHWTSETRGVTSSRGNALDIETTALTACAMLKAKHATDTAHKALQWLISKKDSRGTWHSTQATVHAMRALLAGAGPGGSIEQELNVTVAVNGRLAKQLNITPETSDVFRLISLRELVRTGENTVAIETAGDEGLAFQVVATHYLPWPATPKPAHLKQPLEIDVEYDATTVKRDETLTAKVTIRYNRPGAAQMTIVDLGIPPGFQVLTEAFDTLKKKGIIEKYTLTGRQVTLYFRTIPGGKPITFEYRLRAKYPVRAKTPPSRTYQYYEPEVNAEAQPVLLTIL